MKKFSFPVIDRVELKNFTLYKKRNHISINVGKGVFCLAGANGLGKSTFINILNYGLTGIVRRSDSEFSISGSIPKFYSDSKSFAAKYFDRRIDENLREAASVTIEFTLKDTTFNLTRGFFEQDSLLELSIMKDGVNQFDNKNLTPTDLDRIYKEKITSLIGLKDFDQYVFLQIFVFTFDETHQLLFWDKNLMERVLHLFFNLNPQNAKLADQLRKEISTYESNMRNLQWDATQKEKELTGLINQMDIVADNQKKADDSVIENYQELASNLSDQLDSIQKLDGEVKECELLSSDYSLKNLTLKNDYDTLFNQSFNQDTSLEKDPTIISLLTSIRKKICGNEDASELFIELKEFIWEKKCPNNLITNNADSLNLLQKLDEEIYKNNTEQEKYIKRKNRLIKDYEKLRATANDIKNKMEEIEKANENFLFSLYQKSGGADLSVLVTTMRSQIDSLLQNKREETEKRDKRKLELKKLEKELNQQYIVAEETFMPVFIEYARNFLGLDINIYLQTYAKGATLILEVNDSERREKHQLSESQRYFIDIALRMALIQHSSDKALMLIDTPEGSLDIAYESKAGQMFADFTERGYNLFITANINSSMLIHRLASQCKAKGMKLEKMTEWTSLSVVQQNEESEIDKAFNEIEKLLN